MPEPEDIGPLGAHLVGEGFALVQRARSCSPAGRRLRSSSRPGCSRSCARTAAASLAHAARGGRPRRPGPGRGGAGQRAAAATPASARPSTATRAARCSGDGRACLRRGQRPPRRGRGGHRRPRRHGVSMHDPSTRQGIGRLRGRRRRARRPAARPVRSTPSSSLSPVRPAIGHTAPWERILAEHDGLVDRHPRRCRVGARGATAPRRPGARSDWSRSPTPTRPAVAAGRRPPPSCPGPRAAPPTTASRRSRSASRRRRRRHDRPSWPPTSWPSPDAAALSGAELVVGRGLGRAAQPPASHRDRSCSAGTDVPEWLDDALRTHRREAR